MIKSLVLFACCEVVLCSVNRFYYLQALKLFKHLSLVCLEKHMDLGIIQKLAKCIVRPPKADYDIEDLVPPCFEMRSQLYERQDFTVVNSRNFKLQASLIRARYQANQRDTIVFLHANGSSRLIMKNYLDVFLPHYDMVSFDFAACGASEGEYITLGYNEREDVYAIISYLRKQYKMKNFVLWGRSMGAATALLYAAKYGGINAIISDNSYSDLEMLINQLSDDYLPFLPSFLLESIIDSIQQYIENALWKKESTDFNLRKLKPINIVERVACPVFYVGSIEDTFVNVNHTKALFNKTRGIKHLELVKGNHNDMRTKDLKEKIYKFLSEQANAIKSDPNNRERGNIFLSQTFHKTQTANKNNQKNLSSPSKVQLVNCAQLEYQPQTIRKNTAKLESSPKQELSTSFIPAPSNISSPRSRQPLINRQGKFGNRAVERSRSKVKRKKIFEGIDYINEHLNGNEN